LSFKGKTSVLSIIINLFQSLRQANQLYRRLSAVGGCGE